MDGMTEHSSNTSTNPAEVTLEVETNVDLDPALSQTAPPTLGQEVTEDAEPAVITASISNGSTAKVAAASPVVLGASGGAASVQQQQQQQQHQETKEFESISLEEKRQPRRVIHFSDGVVEEYSTDEEDGEEKELMQQPPVDPKTLTWVPYIWHYAVVSSFAAYRVCDFVGERLAYFFGITSPKYGYALSEYNRLEEEEQDALKQEIAEREEHRDRVARDTAAKAYGDST